MKIGFVHSICRVYLVLATIAQYACVYCSDLSSSPQRRAASKLSRRWMNRPKDGNWEIPYVTEDLDDETVLRIQEAVEEFRNKTCLRFIPRTHETMHYIRFIRGYSCSSAVGMMHSGPNKITLSSNCASKGSILHEIMHAIGFYHEHTRPDRDQFIKIWKENIIPSMRFNFKALRWDQIVHYGADYDLQSIMHYPSDAFSQNGKDTITAHNGEPLNGLQGGKLSETDIYQVNKMYKCKDCQDIQTFCRNRATKRRCKRSGMMRRMCRKSCDLC